MSGDERDESDRALEARLRGDMGQLVQATRPEIRDRLRQAASAAAAQSRPARPRAPGLRWQIGIAAAAAAALAVVIWRPVAPPERPRSPAADDLALLLNVDNLDLLEQMEFYQWLDRDPALLDSASAPEAQRS
jgi:hypothetical protein